MEINAANHIFIVYYNKERLTNELWCKCNESYTDDTDSDYGWFNVYDIYSNQRADEVNELITIQSTESFDDYYSDNESTSTDKCTESFCFTIPKIIANDCAICRKSFNGKEIEKEVLDYIQNRELDINTGMIFLDMIPKSWYGPKKYNIPKVLNSVKLYKDIDKIKSVCSWGNLLSGNDK